MAAVKERTDQAEAAATRRPVVFYQTKTFTRALNAAFMAGGQAQKRAERVKVVLGSLGDDDPFRTTPVTNNGETRIPHCVKYDLGDGWRLVTVQDANSCFFVFVGDHGDTERWLNNNKGQTFGSRDRRMVQVPGFAADGAKPAPDRFGPSTPLLELLDGPTADELTDGLPRSVVRSLDDLTQASLPDAVTAAVAAIADDRRRAFVEASLQLLREGNVDGARARIDLQMGRIVAMDALSPEDFLEVQDGEDVRRLRVGSPEHEIWLAAFEKRSSWQDWFLFLHPEQAKVVEADYKGSAQLSGVSGSGKTCVVVRRALRLAEQSTGKVLVVTLNRSLAGLLRQLVDAACINEATRDRIEVTSFFELARDLLLEFEPENARLYQDVTWKLGEHVDEVFRQYYRQWENNIDAAVLEPLNRSLNVRGVSGEKYLRGEFDWIRSAFAPCERSRYLDVERLGRRFGIVEEWRRDILEGLLGWERKMREVGVIDYAGLTSALARHTGRIAPRYAHVLVDEAQDFGTSELQVLRALTRPGPNDLFLAGDVAQSILPKHRSLLEAGVRIPLSARERICKNYRNSREILRAAHDVLMETLHEELFDGEGLEVLDPQFANFSGPVPMALRAQTLEEEIGYARAYAATSLARGMRSVCIALAGYSARDVSEFARSLGIASLDGGYSPSAAPLVMSDLEQAKGYEFDVLVIVNCRDGVLPARDAPAEEAFRDACKLYVAMTRARRELVLSFHDAASPWLRAVSGSIAAEGWADCEECPTALLGPGPARLPEHEGGEAAAEWGMAGPAFLYTTHAVELSPEAQAKLIELVDGVGLTSPGRGRLRWRTVGGLVADLLRDGRHDKIAGPKVAEELRTKLGQAEAIRRRLHAA